MRLFRRRRQRVRPISEAEAYDRSYGARSADVRVVEGQPPASRPRPRYDVLSRGEKIREAFSSRLAARRRPESEQ